MNNDLTTLYDIPAIHEQLGIQIVEVNSTLQQFMNKFQGPSSSDPPLCTEYVDSNRPLSFHSNSLPREHHIRWLRWTNLMDQIQ